MTLLIPLLILAQLALVWWLVRRSGGSNAAALTAAIVVAVFVYALLAWEGTLS